MSALSFQPVISHKRYQTVSTNDRSDKYVLFISIGFEGEIVDEIINEQKE